MPKIKVRYESIHEILTIKEYWNLIRPQPILAITWEPDFSQTCSFYRILKDHKNFHFIPIPDKANHLIFKKVRKILFFGPFWHSFFQKILLYHIQLNVAPNTILSFRKNKWANSEKTCEYTIGRTDRCKDRPSFIGPFWPCPDVQQEKPQRKSQIKQSLTTLNTGRAT